MVDRHSSIFVFNFTKTFSYYPPVARLTNIIHSSQECVSSIVSSETKSIKTCFIFL